MAETIEAIASPEVMAAGEVLRTEVDETCNSIQQTVDDILAKVTRHIERQRLPVATYRVQLNSHCTFANATAFVPYLAELGISDLYASPLTRARPGSVHGYDVVDHTMLNPEIGSLDELRALSASLRKHELGLIADVVPNHMCAVPQVNAWWRDVLENGPSSPYAAYFDIDWMPLKPDLANKVLLPVLGDQFGKVLEEGQLVVRYEDGTFVLKCYDSDYPLAPGTYATILNTAVDWLREKLGEEHADVQELLSILTAIRNLPPRTETNEERLAERRREKEIIKRRLQELTQRSTEAVVGQAGSLPHVAETVGQAATLPNEAADAIAHSVCDINGRAGEPASFDRLDQLLGEQAYRLSYWRVASDEINYRRFFDVNQLAAICVEHPQVFEETHQLFFDLLDAEIVTGLRIDHPDGLYDPCGYLEALQQRRFLQLCRREYPAAERNAAAEQWPRLEERLRELWNAAIKIPGSPLARGLYVAVEKILARGETLPANWPVHGTVGYEYLNALNGLFVDRSSERAVTAAYQRFTGEEIGFAELAYQCKRLIVRMSMASEVSVLGHQLDRISERNRWTRDFTLSSLTRALQEVAACFSVYRTYIQDGLVMEHDRHYLEQAVARAKRRNPAMSASIFDFVRDALLLHYRENADPQEIADQQRFVGKFQQVTGPIMAKGVEDTAFYRFNRLSSLNEVGGEPAHYGSTVEEFHAFNQGRVPRSPHTLSATSTHDTKRSEDVRARINVLSELPKQWRERLQRWARLNRRLKTEVDGGEAPSRNDEYLLYQTMIGVWPDDLSTGHAQEALVARLQQYAIKVAREAKVHTSWISPHEPYEAELTRFVKEVLRPDPRRPFWRDFDGFARQVADHGRWNSLSQVLLKIASPGAPDFYQGTELWTLTLVDPDNRQPVDMTFRQAMLKRLVEQMAAAVGTPREKAVAAWLAGGSPGTVNREGLEQLLSQIVAERADGRIKLFVTLLALRARRQMAELFTGGDYIPLSVTGKFAENIVAFARRQNDRTAICVAPRLTVGVVGFSGPPPIGDFWGDTAVQLPERFADQPLRNIFTLDTYDPPQSHLLAADVLRHFPVAALITENSPGGSNHG